MCFVLVFLVWLAVNMSLLSSWSTNLLCSYELQVSQSAQRGGMGKTLMGCLYDIARRWKYAKGHAHGQFFKSENVSVSLFDFPVLRGYSAENKLHSHFTRLWGGYDFSH